MDKLGYTTNAKKQLDTNRAATTPTNSISPSKGKPQVRAILDSKGDLIRQAFLQRTFEANENDLTALDAIANGKWGPLAISIARGALDINGARYYGMTALTLAATENQQEMVKTLLSHGAEVDNGNVRGQTALILAAQNGNVSMMKCLISRGANINHRDGEGMTALHRVVASGNVEAARALIRAGADIDIADGNGNTPLTLALRAGRADMIRGFQAAGADLNRFDSEGNTPLIVAVKNGYVNGVKCLVELGADLNPTDNEGNTALIWASRNNNASLVDALMMDSEHLDANHRNAQGDTALTIAVKSGCTEAVKALLERSVDVNITDAAGNTPLMCAALDQRATSIAEILLKGKQKPDLTKRNNEGKMAIEIAASEWDGEDFASLLNHYLPADIVQNLRRTGMTWVNIKMDIAKYGVEKIIAAIEERKKWGELNQMEVLYEGIMKLISRAKHAS
ncbi:ankyrin repeat domain-containing protein [Noviherbaspirillum pedocola]|uniref:Ankyrin repeat domain-containing protein n=1 Tax=Noviherbaspirillum pedocola TaxID=2801341 RepID=A0A934SQB1_9BURK|nr:ankyrin repeat domain-containing protein [Noviherbaspirillum pedocola]MBK4733338.1 ankyrin repeat domain-containing protein [Noviherbaspirillum pedocola]